MRQTHTLPCLITPAPLPILLHRAPEPAPVDDPPLPNEHPAPQQDPVPSPHPEQQAQRQYH